LSDSRKDGRSRGAHVDSQGREFWASRLHRGGELIGRFTKLLTHRKERRAGKRAARNEASA